MFFNSNKQQQQHQQKTTISNHMKKYGRIMITEMLKMPKESKKILNYTHSQKSIYRYWIFAGKNAYKNNLENLSIRKVGKHTACGHSIFTECASDNRKA